MDHSVDCFFPPARIDSVSSAGCMNGAPHLRREVSDEESRRDEGLRVSVGPGWSLWLGDAQVSQCGGAGAVA